MSGRGTRLPSAVLVGALVIFASGCGQVRDAASTPSADGGAAGSGGEAGAREVAGSAGAEADPAAVALDTSDCAARLVADCQGVKPLYLSDNAVFDATPALAQCSNYNSWDGCETLQFTFDAQGCASTVAAHGPPNLEPLPELRQCLTAALQGARWPCLVLGTLRYEESCFIR